MCVRVYIAAAETARESNESCLLGPINGTTLRQNGSPSAHNPTGPGRLMVIPG